MKPGSGGSFCDSVYRDVPKNIVNRSTATTALAVALFKTKAAVDAFLLSGQAVRMGAGDGLELFCVGTAAENLTINYLVTGLHPVWSASETNDNADPLGYLCTPRAQGVFTLGATTVGAAGNGICGCATADLIADTVTNTLGLGGVTAYSPAGDGVAHLRIDALQSSLLLVESDLGTAALANIFGRRLQGAAFNVIR